jgi:hypothetical protein
LLLYPEYCKKIELEAIIAFGSLFLSAHSSTIQIGVVGFMKTEYLNIKRIIASVGGYFGSSYTYEVELVSGNITYEAREDGVSEADLILQMDIEGIYAFREVLSKCRILDWKKEYIDPDTIDGTQWSLDIELEDRSIHINGSNAYPKEWKRFCKVIQVLTGKPFE